MHSMTGFGSENIILDDREINIIIKSVNHRFLDIAVKEPKSLIFIENHIRDLVSKRVSRGHFDVLITYRNTRKDSKTIVFDEALFQQYMNVFKTLNINSELNHEALLSISGLITVSESEEDQEAITEICDKAINSALDKLIEMRKIEGEKLKQDLIKKTESINGLFESIKKRAEIVPLEYRKKLTQRISEISKISLDEQRIEMEVAVFADRANIDEEIVRFGCHMEQFCESLKSEVEVGRKLDFTLQELNREINTITSKANDFEISNIVTNIKAELEKLREQVQNIE